MTVEVEYELPRARAASDWQVNMAEQIEVNRGFPIKDQTRILDGTTLIVRVANETLPSTAVDNMTTDIEDYLSAGASHIETRDV